MGIWYEINHSAHTRYQPDSNVCTQANYYDLNASDGTFKVDNSSQVSLTDSRFHLVGAAECPATFASG